MKDLQPWSPGTSQVVPRPSSKSFSSRGFSVFGVRTWVSNKYERWDGRTSTWMLTSFMAVLALSWDLIVATGSAVVMVGWPLVKSTLSEPAGIVHTKLV